MTRSRIVGTIFGIVILAGLNGCNEIQPAKTTEASEVVSPTMELTGRVVDQANLLDEEAETTLRLKLSKLETESGPQFVIATTNDLQGREINEYSLALANAWQIGHSERNDGVVLLVAPNERKVRIEVGYGLETSLSDPFCAEVLHETVLPIFATGDMQAGILAGANRLIEKMQSTPTIELNDNEPSLPPEKATS